MTNVTAVGVVAHHVFTPRGVRRFLFAQPRPRFVLCGLYYYSPNTNIPVSVSYSLVVVRLRRSTRVQKLASEKMHHATAGGVPLLNPVLPSTTLHSILGYCSYVMNKNTVQRIELITSTRPIYNYYSSIRGSPLST